jgi:hypothetical protein
MSSEGGARTIHRSISYAFLISTIQAQIFESTFSPFLNEQSTQLATEPSERL